jgi:TRAP-type C4-dicarboxylate transport system permease small subunit
MKQLGAVTVRLSRFMRAIGAFTLAGMMLITVVDVILRYLGRPFMGTYEIVSLCGAIVIGCAMPQTTLQDGHVKVDFLVGGTSGAVKLLLVFTTKFLGMGLFCLLGYGLMSKATELVKAGEVSLTIHIPLYPVCYGLGICCFVESLALAHLLLKELPGRGSRE